MEDPVYIDGYLQIYDIFIRTNFGIKVVKADTNRMCRQQQQHQQQQLNRDSSNKIQKPYMLLAALCYKTVDISIDACCLES